MRVAIVGSRTASKQMIQLIYDNLPNNCSEIVSGGAKGIDQLAQTVAQTLQIPLTVILPDYGRYGKRAPLVRNTEIVSRADYVLAFWDLSSRGTKFVLSECVKFGKPFKVIEITP
jgi:hypothetical protein